ncbi:haloacid dehalogenase-like hydrolase [Phlyctema vagabunda]|uniref:Haloacid dehalogenase-like hydrolase n=1 Tax=Phlyctema vagabunda TaxID=108571 RepID=A0ABR4P5D6_9HELO
MADRANLPAIRACLFDMDGLLVDTEEKLTICTNLVLAKYNRPPIPWSIIAQLQGRPAGTAGAILEDWAQLPISRAQYYAEVQELQKIYFPTVAPLAGVEQLLADLQRARTTALGSPVHLALATSTGSDMFAAKTGHLTGFFDAFPPHRRVLGDDVRIADGRGKPAPDIYRLALRTINESLPVGESPVAPDECLVFEDSVPGVEAGRRAGMQVVWCPDPALFAEYRGRHQLVLAGATGEGGTEVEDGKVGIVGDGFARYLPTLENFPYQEYDISIT